MRASLPYARTKVPLSAEIVRLLPPPKRVGSTAPSLKVLSVCSRSRRTASQRQACAPEAQHWQSWRAVHAASGDLRGPTRDFAGGGLMQGVASDECQSCNS